MAEVARGCARWLRRARGRRTRFALLVAGAGFGLWVVSLMVVGAVTGVWAAEYIPTALVEGLVIAGLLFVASLPPEEAESDGDGGEHGREPAPPSPAPVFDAALWSPLFADARDAGALDGDRERAGSPGELVGASERQI